MYTSDALLLLIAEEDSDVSNNGGLLEPTDNYATFGDEAFTLIFQSFHRKNFSCENTYRSKFHFFTRRHNYNIH